jgi:DNA-binding transcriptional MerR regulator
MTVTAVPSYRQLDYWTSKGYLRGGNPGSGHRRDWTDHELAIAEMIGRLRSAGIELEAAGRLARELHEHGHAALGPGLMIASLAGVRCRYD